MEDHVFASNSTGEVKFPDGTRAGSTLTPNVALKNFLVFTGRPQEEVLPTLTENPAHLIGESDHKGSIADRKDAALVLPDEDNTVFGVYVRGKRVVKKRLH